MATEPLTPATVRKIVETELGGMPEDIAARARHYLVEPYISERPWAYGPELFECWVVLADLERSGSGIAYCREGVWQPDRKWILLWVDGQTGRNDLGQDSSWFSSLESAFSESFIAVDQA